jgi:hypothetical protein
VKEQLAKNEPQSYKYQKVLAVISVKKMGGNGYDFNVFGRIADAYGNCGKQLGHYLLDKKSF